MYLAGTYTRYLSSLEPMSTANGWLQTTARHHLSFLAAAVRQQGSSSYAHLVYCYISSICRPGSPAINTPHSNGDSLKHANPSGFSSLCTGARSFSQKGFGK